MTYKDLFKSKKEKEATKQEAKTADAPKAAPAPVADKTTAAPSS